jgi:hypothetical protein
MCMRLALLPPLVTDPTDRVRANAKLSMKLFFSLSSFLLIVGFGALHLLDLSLNLLRVSRTIFNVYFSLSQILFKWLDFVSLKLEWNFRLYGVKRITNGDMWNSTSLWSWS